MKIGDMVEVVSMIGVFPANREAATIMIGNTWIIEELSWPGELPMFTITDKYHKRVDIKLPRESLRLVK